MRSAGEGVPANNPDHRRLLDDSFLRFLPAPLREPRRAWLVIPLAWALTFFGSIALAYLFSKATPNLETPTFPMKGWGALFALVVFAPFVETLIMAGAITILRKFLNDPIAIAASSIGWGIAHSMQALGWGLVIWWPFLIFSTLYVVWRQRGFWIAVLLVTAVHACQNLLPGLTVAFPELMPVAV